MKKNSSYVLIALALLVIALIAVAGCTGAGKSAATPSSPALATTPTNAPIPLNIGYLPTNGHALIFIAQEEGYFTKNGLNVTLYSFQNSGDGANAIIAKKIDTGGFGPTPLIFASKGTPETIIGGLMGEGAGVVALPDKAKQFTDIASFKGKTIATVRLSSGDIHFRGAFQNAGFDLKKDITIQELASPSAVLEAVKAGKVDAGIVWTPYMELAQSQGLTVALYTDQYYPLHPCCRIAVLTENLNANRDAYIRMEKALIEAYNFSKANPSGTVDDIAKYVKIDKGIIKSAVDSKHFYISPDPNTKAIDKTYALLKSINYINTTVNIDDHIDSTVYKQALDDLSKQNPENTVYQQLETDYKIQN